MTKPNGRAEKNVGSVTDASWYRRSDDNEPYGEAIIIESKNCELYRFGENEWQWQRRRFYMDEPRPRRGEK